MRAIVLILAAAVMSLVVSASGQELYRADAGPYAVATREATWHDDARGRDVPVKVYLPSTKKAEGQTPAPAPEAKGPWPVVVFSHGLGASREMYSYFGEHIASWGYLVVHPQHAGSDTPAMAKGLLERRRDPAGKERDKDSGNSDDVPEAIRGGPIVEFTSDPENLKNRPRDVSFVLDYLGKSPEWSKLADLSRVAVAGHSFGSYTALAIDGMKVHIPGKDSDGKPIRTEMSFRDPRVKAVIAMSPQGAGMMGVQKGAWKSIEAPTLILTGTRDMGVGERTAAWRREAFDGMPKTVDACFVIWDGATHMTFGGKAGPLGKTKEDRWVREIDSACTAFLDCYLKEDAGARGALQSLKATLKGEATVETTPAAAPRPPAKTTDLGPGH